ncbi:MAG TPA: YdcF family protein [Bryobacteraceae bacterium]|nr:YdcF family protein [Bryobacteraceae bacterium]
MAYFRRSLRWAIPLLIVVVATSPLWLRAAGRFLVTAQEPAKAEMIVVLAGDDHGNRILKAAELVRQGFAPKILVDGPYCCYGNVESDLAIAFAVRKGYPAEWFVSLPMKARSTVEEARYVIAELDRRHVGNFLIVTSNYHSRRAARVFGRLVPAGRFRMIAAQDWAFRPEDWWRSRDGQKQVFFEWSKTLANWAGL